MSKSNWLHLPTVKKPFMSRFLTGDMLKGSLNLTIWNLARKRALFALVSGWFWFFLELLQHHSSPLKARALNWLLQNMFLPDSRVPISSFVVMVSTGFTGLFAFSYHPPLSIISQLIIDNFLSPTHVSIRPNLAIVTVKILINYVKGMLLFSYRISSKDFPLPMKPLFQSTAWPPQVVFVSCDFSIDPSTLVE